MPSTVVARVYPTGDVVPENLLRMYIEFSGPMGRPSGIPYMKLLDEKGEEIRRRVPAARLRVLESRSHALHRVLRSRPRQGRHPAESADGASRSTPGRSVTLVISREWRDEHGLPLKEDYRRVLRVGPPDDQPLDTATWRIQPPAGGGRDRVVVTFPEPLDHGLLMRALGVTRDGAPLEGDIVVDDAETRWTFTPREPWRAGTYQLLALDILEDVAGQPDRPRVRGRQLRHRRQEPEPEEHHDPVHAWSQARGRDGVGIRSDPGLDPDAAPLRERFPNESIRAAPAAPRRSSKSAARSSRRLTVGSSPAAAFRACTVAAR